MILLNAKSLEELQTESSAALSELWFSTSPGAIAKLFLNIINKQESDLYDVLTLNLVQAFVSTATDDFLDAIGVLLHCFRNADEEDDDYRYRVTNQILNMATSNETAIRLAALSTEGVQDVMLKKYSFGSGSFSVLIVSDSPITSPSILNSVEVNVEKVVGFGIKFNIINPDLNNVKIQIKLLLKDTVSDGDGQEIKFNVKDALKTYLTTKNIGDPIVIPQITQTIMNVDNEIVSYSCEKLTINGKTTMFVDQDCKWTERFMLSSDPDAIIIS
jgi:uncharacterized phage protein gp47/JayE